MRGRKEMRTNDESTRAIATGTTKARGRLNIRLIHGRGRDMNLKKRHDENKPEQVY